MPVIGTNGSMQWSVKESDGSGGQAESLLVVQGDLNGMVSPSRSLKHELTMCVNWSVYIFIAASSLDFEKEKGTGGKEFEAKSFGAWSQTPGQTTFTGAGCKQVFPIAILATCSASEMRRCYIHDWINNDITILFPFHYVLKLLRKAHSAPVLLSMNCLFSMDH